MTRARELKTVVHPVTPDRWEDLRRLFEARGGPHHCWCVPYRFANAQRMDSPRKRAAMKALVEDATPVGVLAYRGGQVVGWCSVAPRESYVRLRRSRTMPRMTDEATPTWIVLCFFVARPARGSGVNRALLAGAIDYVQGRGGRVIEGYPHDTAGISSTHLGHSSVFAAAGFERQGRRWSLDLSARAPTRASRRATPARRVRRRT